MKKLLLILALAGVMPATVMAQDDMYFVPGSSQEETTPKNEPTVQRNFTSYYIGSSRDVDEYNRYGKLNSYYQKIGTDSLGNDIVTFNTGDGTYGDSTLVDTAYIYPGSAVFEDYDDGNDYTYTRRMSMYDDYYGWYNPWSYGYGWSPYSSYWGGYYSPWSSWYSGWGYGFGYPYYGYGYGFGYPYYGWGYGYPYYGGGYYGGYYGGGYSYYPSRGGHTGTLSGISRGRYSGNSGSTSGRYGYNTTSNRTRTGGNTTYRGGVNRGNATYGARRGTTETRTYQPSYNNNNNTRSNNSTPSYSSGSRSGGFSSGGGGRSSGGGGGMRGGGRR